MLEGGSRHRELERQILQSRIPSVDNRTVVYNLTRGVDFSHPRATAEAVAQVVWDQDVQAWWTVEGGDPACTPTGTIEIWIPREHNHKVAKAVEAFRKDLKEDEVAGHFGAFLDRAENYDVGWGTIFLMGPLWAALMEGSENKGRRRAALDALFSQMGQYIHVIPR